MSVCIFIYLQSQQFLPSFEGASLFVDGLILESILRSATDDRSTKKFTKKWVNNSGQKKKGF